MSAGDLERELKELGVDLALRDVWHACEPIIAEAQAGGEPIQIPQFASAIRAAYGRGFNDALAWVEGTPALAPDPNEPPIR